MSKGQTTQRIALWAGPRDIATLMMYSFLSRDDAYAIDEPLHGYYLGFSGQDRYYRDDVLKNMDIDPSRIVETLTRCELNKPLLFTKHIANQIIGLQWDFLTEFSNVILIQEPSQMIRAYRKHIPGIDLLDLSYEVQYHILLYLIEQGIEPIVVESSQLVERPMEIMNQLCRKLNIEYRPEMLQWESGAKQVDGIWAEHWYREVWTTERFQDMNDEPEPDAIPKELGGLYEEALKHYLKLERYALKLVS